MIEALLAMAALILAAVMTVDNLRLRGNLHQSQLDIRLLQIILAQTTRELEKTKVQKE